MSDACARSTTENGAETTNLDLLRRAVACKAFRWLPGMLAVEQAVPGMALSTRPVRVDNYWHAVGVWLPDLTDPATLGCLLALVREAWGPAYGTGRPHLRPTATGWFVASCGYPVAPEGLTEAEALVAALECAP
jgi:hypothetical protein